ncbi:hypothetical protein HMPREF1212_03437 [Parabacteroides sp. HGS0025]|nr:hypothetical protein HMPREF1212_03437 [Parabacteroides sp. HGS0025]
MFVLFVMQSYLTEVRGLKQKEDEYPQIDWKLYLTEVRGVKQLIVCRNNMIVLSYLTEARGLKHGLFGV